MGREDPDEEKWRSVRCDEKGGPDVHKKSRPQGKSMYHGKNTDLMSDSSGITC
ncbi:unnamed protein product [Gulo gulo]|uniref:Uncharacterized protein n=1 Tax=Gulo gulo TaxID=48420 RepID=A0A9X9Q2F7_GULGU|nr:unnamed protein product [Gulo gulo]